MSPVPSPDRASAPLSAYERLLAVFGGKQQRLVEAAQREQSAVSKWRERGVPLSAAIEICDRAEAFGVALKFEDVKGWIAADRARRRRR